MTTKNEILLSHGFINLPELTLWQRNGVMLDSQQAFGTFLANLAAYGFAPNVEALKVLTQLSATELGNVWRELEPSIKAVTGADRKMADYVVYKNFPKEVLDMSQAQYWFNQIFMYVGFPSELFAQPEKERAPLNEKLKLKVLHLASDQTLMDIWVQLFGNKARWTTDQKAHAEFLIEHLQILNYDVTAFGFKENAINLLVTAFGKIKGGSVVIPDATDVLRLASAMSGSEASLRGDVKFKNLSRPVRRFLVNLLENSKNLDADVAARQDLFRKLLMRLHPGEFKAPRVQAVYDQLYRSNMFSQNALVENLIQSKDIGVLGLLASRPGEYVRRFHHLMEVFHGAQQVVADGLLAVVDRLSTSQLLKLSAYLRTVNERKQFMYAPKGVWSKVQLGENSKTKIPLSIVTSLRDQIREIIAGRVDAALPDGVEMVEETRLDAIKLQTNDQELAPYGRGTEFDIPENMTFLRTASYWKVTGLGTVWFDNGWNFFDEDWRAVGTCCWTKTQFPEQGYNFTSRRSHKGGEIAAVFSGDPVSSRKGGYACQMIDLYLDKLAAAGVRYAVWNVLCYNNIPFSKADEVLATLQWGENPEAGELYEAARAQMVFPLTGENKTKYVAYIDVARRKLVYVDANLPGKVRSADSNEGTLSTMMPAFIEYLKAQPSVYDLFDGAKAGSVPILYSDEGVEISDGKAYVFQKHNSANKFTQLDLTKLLA